MKHNHKTASIPRLPFDLFAGVPSIPHVIQCLGVEVDGLSCATTTKKMRMTSVHHKVVCIKTSKNLHTSKTIKLQGETPYAGIGG